jgi:hypothetical protein
VNRKPDAIYKRIEDISLSLLEEWGIKGIILDVDGTLLSRKAKEVKPAVIDWVMQAKAHYKILILSNNSPKKIQRASELLDLPYIAWTIKPYRCYFQKALRKLQLNPDQVCTIGDQLFTDIEGGKRVGTKTVYVYPIAPEEDMLWTRWRRIFEKKLLTEWVNQNT